MLGISSICNNYTCYEPSTKTCKGLKDLTTFIQQFRSTFCPLINCSCFEDAKIHDENYDFAITSPPYYDTEIYTDEITNSLNRYKCFNDWVSGFYLPLIKITMQNLKQGGVFVLNIGSRKYPLNKILFENFGSKYKITRVGGLSGSKPGGLAKKG